MLSKIKTLKDSSVLQILVFIITLAVYILTLLPGIGYSGDTVKFQFIGKILGTPHTTGYPTYIIINHFFVTYFPFGTLALKANLLSALLSSITCLMLFRIMLILDINKINSFIISTTFGFSYTLWSQSVIAEVYTLHILFISLTLYFFISWQKDKNILNFLIGCAIYAISFGNHLTMITIFPALLYLVYATDKKLYFNWKIIFLVALFIFLGAFQYSYLFWRYYDPSTKYIEFQAPDWSTFWWTISGGDFKSLLFSSPIWKIIFIRIPVFTFYFLREFYWWIPVIFIGIAGLKKWIKLNIFFILCICGNLFFALNYNIDDIYIYLLPTYFICAIYLGIGIDKLFLLPPNKHTKLIKKVFYLTPFLFFLLNITFTNQRFNTEDNIRTEEILNTVNKNALIISPNYPISEYFWYYLFGMDYQEKKNLYLMHNYSEDNIVRYINNSKTFTLTSTEETVPDNLNVYMIESYISKNRLKHFAKTFLVRFDNYLDRKGVNLPKKIKKRIYKADIEKLEEEKKIERLRNRGLKVEKIKNYIYLIKK